MRILVVGSGAREHAILRKLNLENTHDLYCVGGNPGIWQIAQEVVLDGEPVDELDAIKIANACVILKIDLIVIGPEAPLASGVADVVAKNSPDTAIFAPTKSAAQLESSKSFAKDVMLSSNVATANAVKCENQSQLEDALKNADANYPFVVKADGLAAGKGVIVTKSIDDAKKHADNVFSNGGFVILEEYLSGPEFSMFFVCDGQSAVPLMPAQDFKRIFDDDSGPNTGGMGAYLPLEWLPKDIMEECKNDIALPVLQEMQSRGTPFVGVLFAGLVYTENGVKVIEFNVRFGDPETQVVLEKLDSNLSELLFAAATKNLKNLPSLKWNDKHYCNVVLASKGYPETSSKGDWIDGIDAANSKGAVVLQAGTAFSGSDIGQIITNGGRVLSVIAKGNSLKIARERAYNYCNMIKFEGKQNRTDIALKACEGNIKI